MIGMAPVQAMTLPAAMSIATVPAYSTLESSIDGFGRILDTPSTLQQNSEAQWNQLYSHARFFGNAEPRQHADACLRNGMSLCYMSSPEDSDKITVSPHLTKERLRTRILANRDDNEAWRIYGDLLIESTDSIDKIRGKLIQIHYALEDCSSKQRSKLERQRKNLQEKLTEDFLAPFRDVYGMKDLKWQRGQLTGLRIERGFGSIIEDLANSPYLSDLHSLELNSFGSIWREFLAVANSPYLSQLRSLEMRGCHIDIEGFQALAQASNFSQLHSLYLSECEVYGRGAQILANSTNFTRLRSLVLRDNEIGVIGARALASSPYLSRLQSLDMASNGIMDEGVQALFNSPHLSKLKSLDLSYNPVRPAGAQVIAEAHSVTRLRSLYLERTELADEGVQILASSPHLATLLFLNLSSNNIGDAGAIALANSPHLAKLKRLDLYDNPIGARGRRALENSPYLTAEIIWREMVWRDEKNIWPSEED